MPGKNTSRTAERLEWILGIVSGIVVAALAGYLTLQGIADTRTPPRLSVAAEPGPSGEVRFTVHNDGGRTATAVALSLIADGTERRLVIDYLPGHSEASGGFVLPAGVNADASAIVVEGYLDP